MQSISLPPFFVEHLLEFFMGHKLFVSIQNGYIEIGISVTCISEMTTMKFDSVLGEIQGILYNQTNYLKGSLYQCHE